MSEIFDVSPYQPHEWNREVLKHPNGPKRLWTMLRHDYLMDLYSRALGALSPQQEALLKRVVTIQVWCDVHDANYHRTAYFDSRNYPKNILAMRTLLVDLGLATKANSGAMTELERIMAEHARCRVGVMTIDAKAVEMSQRVAA